MNSKDSFILSKIKSFSIILNEFYEYSITYKILEKIRKKALEGLIFSNIFKWLSKEDTNNYAQGSLIIRVIFFVSSIFTRISENIYSFFTKLNETSLNKFVFNKFIMPLTKLEKGLDAFFCVMFGFFLVRFFMVFSNFSTRNIILNAVMAFLFLILLLLDKNFIIRTIKGSFPKKILNYLFNDK